MKSFHREHACWIILFLGAGLLHASAAGPQVASPTATKTSNALAEAAELATHGQLAQAEHVLEIARSPGSENLALLTELAKVKGRLGETGEAVSLFRHVVAVQPQSSEAHLNLSLALADSQQLSEALEEASRSAHLEPTNGAAHSARGLILYDLKRMDEAMAEFAVATKYAPALADAWFYWALLETQQGDAPEASRLLQQVVKLQPRNAKAFALLGKSLKEQGRDREAEQAWSEALAINPDDRPTVYVVAQAERRSNPAESKRLLDRFTALERQKEEADQVAATVSKLGNQAYQAMQTQDWTFAAALLHQAILICGQCALLGDLHKNLGLNACHQGDLTNGRRELDLALALKPADRDIVAALTWISRQTAP